MRRKWIDGQQRSTGKAAERTDCNARVKERRNKSHGQKYNEHCQNE